MATREKILDRAPASQSQELPKHCKLQQVPFGCLCAWLSATKIAIKEDRIRCLWRNLTRQNKSRPGLNSILGAVCTGQDRFLLHASEAHTSECIDQDQT